MRRRDDIDDLCRDIAKMAERVGAKFIPDQKKIAAFRAGRAALAQSDDASRKREG